MEVMTHLMMFQMIFLMKITKIIILMIMPVTMYLMSKIMKLEMKLKNMIRMRSLMNIGKRRKKMKVAAEREQLQ